jgi:hypothetical protein
MTVLIIEVPSVLITYDVFYHQFHPQVLATLLVILQVIAIYSLVGCVYTDPGIIPQIVDRYEWDYGQTEIPAVKHINLSEHKYTMITNGLNIYQKYCI